MKFKLRISTWGKETGLQLGKIIDNINRIMTEKDFISMISKEVILLIR